MKKPLLLLFIATAIASTIYLSVNNRWMPSRVLSINEEDEEEEEEKQSGAARQLNGWYQAKAYPNPENLSTKYQDAWQEYLAIKKNTQQQLGQIIPDGVVSNWTSMGYCANGATRIGGRVVCMAIDPSNTNTLWVGSASGGIWKSINAGSSWVSVPTNLPVLGVSAILVDPSNSNIIYAGTGEVYHTEVGVMGFNVWKTRGTYGIGVIKSLDGGATWSQVMPKTSSDLFAISSMAFLPGSSTTIFACATDGLYRSVNSGGAWTKIYTGINIRDIAINPSNTDQIVISVGNMTNSVKGIYRTTNGSNASPTWTQITSGLPASFDGYITMDNVGSGNLAASIGIGSGNEVYRSTDFGLNWSALSTSSHCQWQFWFAHTIAINPFFTDSLMYGGVDLYRHRTIAAAGRATMTTVHDDQHDIKFDPTRRGTVYVCNDGGVYKSTDGGVNFTAINTGLNATQFYASLGVSKQSANVMIGGLQDNGQVLYNGTNWNKVSWAGGDGTSCAIHPTNDDIIFASRDARQIYRSTDGGSSGGNVTSYWGYVGDSRTAFVAPIAISESDPTIMYQASDNIHISSNTGASFSNNTLGAGDPPLTPGTFIEQRHKTAIALAVSPVNANRLYISTSPFAQADNDDNGIYVNGQPNILKTTTPASVPYASIKGTLPDRFVMDFAISRNNDDSVYVVLGGFGTSHVYLTPDGGTTWLSRGSGLPDVPFNAILIDPVNPRIIYAGCDFGVYVSHNRGLNWYDYNSGFSDATLVMDLQVDANNKLIAATHGKGVFRSDLFTPPVTLPVDFTSFTGQHINGVNELKWEVAQEHDLSHYELERSMDGFSFQKINNIIARNLLAPSIYYYNDNNLNGASSYYYRLKAINADGSYFYSDIVSVKVATKNGFKIMSNPITNQISFRYQATEAGKMTMRLLDQQGRLIRKEEQLIATGTAYYTMNDLSAFPAGMYILEMWINKERYTEKILKR